MSMRYARFVRFLGVFLGMSVLTSPGMAAEKKHPPAPTEKPGPACATERQASKRQEALPRNWLRLSKCLEKAGDVDGAVDAAREALRRALPPTGSPLFLPESARDALLQLDDLGVDIEIPPPGMCGALLPSASCPRPLLACTHTLSGKDKRGIAFERLVINAAHFPKESRHLDDDGTDPRWGQHWLLHDPGRCSWSQRRQGESSIPEDDHATLVLRSRILRECPDDAVGCRIDSTKGGPVTLVTVECRLVTANACQEVIAAVCTTKLEDKPAERHVDLFRVRGGY
ncbi:hypothetical protein JRI60_13390 [Archangium violaceum]|uniref:hypothetical protein n=1 Tax=Archangium violaceum TaxID=83451 RepID=UPI00194EA8D1|nr:hypothetical protein [Archangium violaceum]QRN99947.1 hypothetical protein JRI60_13390 [Archangium violaceum]